MSEWDFLWGLKGDALMDAMSTGMAPGDRIYDEENSEGKQRNEDWENLKELGYSVQIINEYFDSLEYPKAMVISASVKKFAFMDIQKKWIDVVAYADVIKRDHKITFTYAIIEFFKRKTIPKYPKDSSVNIKSAITWITAHEDIEKQRSKGIRGPMFLLVYSQHNVNHGKYKTVYLPFWNEAYGGFDHTGNSPTTSLESKEKVEPHWVSGKMSFKRINDSDALNIQYNYEEIQACFEEEGIINIDVFLKDYDMQLK